MNHTPAVYDLTPQAMADEYRRVLVVSPDGGAWAALLDDLQRQGWQTRLVAHPDELETFSPCLVFIEAADHDAFLVEHARLLAHGLDSAAYCAVIPGADVQEVLACVRSGAGDVLIARPTADEAEAALERLATQLHAVLATRRALEKSNQSLQESLNILRLDHIAGREVQRSMLPKSPTEHGEYRIEHKIVPSLYLSGDFVGHNYVFNRYLLFYFADVSGHGASSAFITVLLRFHLNRIIRKHILGQEEWAVARAPEGLLESINRLVLSVEIDKHLTVFAGAIDTKRNILRYVSGAQLPPPVFIVDGDARFLHGKGKPVGLYEDAEWQVYEISLPKRFALNLVSDGLLETLPGATLLDKERHLQTLLAQAGGNFTDICTALNLDDASERRDDMSVMSITRGIVNG